MRVLYAVLAAGLPILALLPAGCLDKSLGIAPPPPSDSTDTGRAELGEVVVDLSDVQDLPDMPAPELGEGVVDLSDVQDLPDMPAPELGEDVVDLSDTLDVAPDGPGLDLACAPLCGDGLCEVECGEGPVLCPKDCCGSSSCGDGMCAKGCGESQATCPQDCCIGSCGDKVCSKECDETQFTCPKDCCAWSGCGNGKCQRTGVCPEDGENCPADCCECGDTYCEAACGELDPGPSFCAVDC